MRNVGALRTFPRQQIPPIKTPAVHQRERPLTLNPLLDPFCELCLLPIEGPGWYDYSPNGLWGTLVGTNWCANGRYGPAVEFNLVADHVSLGVALPLMFVAGDFSIEQWVYSNNLAANNVTFQRAQWNADGYWLEITAAGAVRFRTFQLAANQATLTAVGVVIVNQWYHIVARRQGAAAQIFVNGVDATAVAGGHINPLINAARIAMVGANAAATIFGFCDLTRVYSRYLGDQEILDLYNQGRPQWMG